MNQSNNIKGNIMKRELKKGIYQGFKDREYNIYIVRSRDFCNNIYIAFDCDPFYGGYAFDFNNIPTFHSESEAIKYAEDNFKNLIWK